MTDVAMTRRRLLAAVPALALAGGLSSARAETLPKVVTSKDPSCGCCGAWVDHMRQAGFPVEVIETAAIDRVKTRLGVPDDLASCHTAEVGGYVIEGHVPAEAVKRLLAEKPQARGLAVPGMPIGSPGMEMGERRDTYEVVQFGPGGRRVFARYEGTRRL